MPDKPKIRVTRNGPYAVEGIAKLAHQHVIFSKNAYEALAEVCGG